MDAVAVDECHTEVGMGHELAVCGIQTHTVH